MDTEERELSREDAKMNKPTEEQIKEFWERCGISQGRTSWWYYPDCIARSSAPQLTLDDLFQWAVPKLTDPDIGLCLLDNGTWNVDIEHKGISFIGEDKDPAIALFWAIYKVIKGGNNESQHR